MPFTFRWPMLALFLACALPSFADAGEVAVFINELHYDNVDTDVGESIEIAGPAGTDLSGWSIVLYNGSGGASYDTLSLAGSIPDHCNGHGVVVATPGSGGQIQNGAPDGLALVQGGTVVQFLSYEGSFTASNGPAAGMTSSDIGVAEGGSTPIGQSLRLTGNGAVYEDFSWQAPAPASFGACNPGQSFTPAIDLPPTLSSLVPADGATGVGLLPTLQASFSEPVQLAPGALGLDCSQSGAVALTLSGGGAVHMAQPQAALANLETCTLTVTGALVTDLDGVPEPMAGNVAHGFTTQADLAPVVAAHQPGANVAGIAPGANLVVDFSEPVTTQAGWLQLSCDGSGAVMVAISGGPLQFVADPDTDLPPLADCTAHVDSALVLDQDGTPTPMAADYHWSFTIAADGGDYYASVDASSPAVLRQTLHELIDDHQHYPYSAGSTDTWDILELADQDPLDAGRVLDIYRNESFAKFGGGTGPYNREHTWPNSLGFPNSGNSHAYTDTHMLMISHVGYNADRGHKYFDDCSAACTERTTLSYNGQGGGSGVHPGNSNWFDGTVWETWMVRRGDVARAMLYMDVRYEGGSHGPTGWHEPDLILTDNPGQIVGTNTATNGTGRAYMGLLTVILDWHRQDPPDAGERLRNDVVYSFQGNRNPFIDHPEWAACLFQDQCMPLGDGIFADGFEDSGD